MENFLLFILALVSLLLLLKWREAIAQNELEGKQVPEAITTDLKSTQGVLCYFYHPKCRPCRQMEPTINHLMEKYPNRVEKFNVADCQELISEIGIKVTPTTIFITNNKIIKAIIGSKSQNVLEKLLLNEDLYP